MIFNRRPMRPGDRWVKQFAWLPLHLTIGNQEVLTVWLESYYRRQWFCFNRNKWIDRPKNIRLQSGEEGEGA